MELHLSCINKFCISYIYATPKQDYNGLFGGKVEHSKPKQNRRYFRRYKWFIYWLVPQITLWLNAVIRECGMKLIIRSKISTAKLGNEEVILTNTWLTHDYIAMLGSK